MTEIQPGPEIIPEDQPAAPPPTAGAALEAPDAPLGEQIPSTDGVAWSQVADATRGAGQWLAQAGSNPAVAAAVLALILLLGAALRFTGLNWDEHQHLHPDERFLTMVENSLQWPKSLWRVSGHGRDQPAQPLQPRPRHLCLWPVRRWSWPSSWAR